MTLEQSKYPVLSVYLPPRTKRTAPCSYTQTTLLTILRLVRREDGRTCVFMEVWVGRLEEDLDAVERCYHRLCLRVRRTVRLRRE